ncbi:hypothetical protein C8046_03180 [Serinibacter arcticus]|uniref:Uncharacterized protein n=1 Tax=Serinibacter arcticus TaxID=1655435 RepID=A0A2U1ZZG1_9MICO|nr:DUF5997 family protein [Serinibacter arcticus]PWD52323.1 hypothetical protein C8046_03180 [Serinibacter arcticus]
MKPTTAARKLEVYLPATPESFQEGVVTRDELVALQQDPPAWLQELRANGPHPRPVVAARLRVSISGLARGGITEALTTAEIAELQDDPPQWLREERAGFAEVRREEARLAQQRAEAAQAAKAAEPPAGD